MTRSQAPRLTIRARLTLSYAALVTGCGGVLILIVWLVMRFVPHYAIVAAPVPGADSSSDAREAADQGIPDQSWGGPTTPPTPDAAPLSVRSAADFLDVLLLVSIGALVLLAALSALLGWIVAGRIVRPLQQVHTAAKVAAAGDLSHRIAHTGPDDEIHRLADAFDDMLGELEQSFEKERRFAANASHELRTPLTVTQTMIEVALAHPDADPADLRALVERIHVVNRGNIQLVEALLTLSDLGHAAIETQSVDIREIVAEEIAALDQFPGQPGVTVSLEHADAAPAIAHGNEVLLRHAMSNLLRNAVQHNVPDGCVTVALTVDTAGQDRRITVRVENTGVELSTAQLGSLAEPFYRAAARVHDTNAGRHHGLGLSLVSAIAAAHRGNLGIEGRAGGGLIATFELPASSAGAISPSADHSDQETRTRRGQS